MTETALGLVKAGSFQVPALIADIGPEATKRYFEFFTVPIRNKNTRIAYYHAIGGKSGTPASRLLSRTLIYSFERWRKPVAKRSSGKRSPAAIGSSSLGPIWTADRPQFQRMLDQIRSSDTIVVWKLDRLEDV
jgi:hypothetical protein